MLLACDGSSEGDGRGGDSTGNAGTTTGPAAVESSSSTSDVPVPMTSGSTAVGTSDGGSSSSTGKPIPDGPYCSVQVVTHGGSTDPLPKGAEPGLFPPSVGDALEDYCGCHTLDSNSQNVEHEGLAAPGGSLFMTYADLSKPYKGTTLGEALAEEVFDFAMPPGSCSFPSAPDDLLRKWFEDGLPDGSAFVPPKE